MTARRRARLLVVTASAVALALAVTSHGAAGGPVAPYAHGGFSEVSVATEDVVAGQASTVARGLAERGYWCVQPRSNDRAVQVACSSPGRDVRVDLVAAPDGDVLYADVDLGVAAGAAGSAGDGERLAQVLDASFLELWPEDRRAVRDLLDDAQPYRFMPLGSAAPPVDAADQYVTRDRRTDNASWSLWSLPTGTPRALRVRTPGLEDRSWPSSGRHYATSVDAATAELVADGFSCATACHRPSDGLAVDLDAHEGQVVAVRLTLRSSPDDPGTDPSGQWVRAGLPFLTPAVRAAVGRRVERSRVEEQSWRGVVAGTPVDVVAVPGAVTTPDGRPAKELVVTVGVPLLSVERPG